MSMFGVSNTSRQTDPRYTSSLAMPERWTKTKRKKDGKVQGFTFRGEGGLLFLRLGAPEQIAEGDVPVWRYTFELSHTVHLSGYKRDNASINDRVFFAEGHIALVTDDPKPVNFARQLSNLIDEYNIAIMRVGRIFEIPEECLGKKDSNVPYEPGGYTLLGVKMDVNAHKLIPGGSWRAEPAEGYNDPAVDWDLKVRYMIRNAHAGFKGAQQIGGVDRWGSRGVSVTYVPDELVGPEVLEDTAGEILTNAVNEMLESTKAHFEMLRTLAATATDDRLDAEERVAAAERLNTFITMNSHSYGIEQGYRFIATPKDPVMAVEAAVKSLLTVLPDIVE